MLFGDIHGAGAEAVEDEWRAEHREHQEDEQAHDDPHHPPESRPPSCWYPLLHGCGAVHPVNSAGSTLRESDLFEG